MDIFNKGKIAELEATLEIYRERIAQLEKFESELKAAQLKMKVMQMLIDDDEAIDELLSASKVKADSGDKMYVDQNYGLRSAGQAWAQAEIARAKCMAGLAGGGISGLAVGQRNIFK